MQDLGNCGERRPVLVHSKVHGHSKVLSECVESSLKKGHGCHYALVTPPDKQKQTLGKPPTSELVWPVDVVTENINSELLDN